MPASLKQQINLKGKLIDTAILKAIHYLLLLIILVGGVFAIPCAHISASHLESDGNARLNIAVTAQPIHYLIKQIAGSHLQHNIYLISNEKTNCIHNQTYTPKNIKSLIQADIIFIIDDRIEKLPSSLSPDTIITLSHAPGLTEIKDTHLWLTPHHTIKILYYIRDTLCKLDQKNQHIYQENTDKIIKEVEQIDQEIKSQNITSQYGILSYHASYQDFCDYYQIKLFPSITDNHNQITPSSISKTQSILSNKQAKCIITNSEHHLLIQNLAHKYEVKIFNPEYIENNYTETMRQMISMFKECLSFD